MNYYECHITMEAEGVRSIEREVTQLGWKFSSIHGDSVFGDTVKCYATKHFNAKKGDDAVLESLNAAAESLSSSGVKVVRRKIEKVIFDDRSSKVQLDE